MRLIGDGVIDREGVPGLAARLGYTSRHLHRMLATELGAGPLALARAQRAQTARTLIESTDLGLADIAFAAGFGSVRQFNDTLREVYAVAPSQLRAQRKAPVRTPGALTLRLAYRQPLHAAALLEFLAARAIPGVERVDATSYARTLRLPHGAASVTLTPDDGYVAAELRLADVRDVAPAVARCRRLLDLDADPVAVDETLAADPALAPLILKDPGVRVPRAVDGFEIAVRAIVGQQVSVPGARTVLGKLVGTAGQNALGQDAVGQDEAGPNAVGQDGELVPFPDAATVAELPDEAFAMPGARRDTIRTLARAVADGALVLDEGADRAGTEAALRALPGVGPWTASYVALRALGDPDVFLSTDLAVRRAAGRLGLPTRPAALDERAQSWWPWRSYAVLRMWHSLK
jgi:AraC family transcriptional regulator of adaptative response / DNA-3-methyladenine glycosylase II